ncbi:MAG TPA: HlyD family efflux transporter periplasmic adaptor subunit [Pseudolabrys sp.]|nr:HlyD family efflux transporter periplasmic adaptor subunit [Pseudolabrys sp.]
MRQSDFSFANDVRAAAELKTPRTARLLLFATLMLIASGATWAHYAILDEVKRGEGRVIPSRQMQVIQSLEGGIVKEILVQEGDTVETGQIVARIDDTKFAADLGEAMAKRKTVAENLKLLDREVDLTRKLYQQKVVPEIEMLKVERQQNEMEGQLAQLDQAISSAKDRVRRAALRSPVHGIVNKINVTTVGAVIQPGADLMDIVPLDDTLLVEGHIRPRDIAFIRPNQDAVVKITAYDPSVFGSLKGKVERISADAISEPKAGERGEKSEPFYRVIVRTDKNYLGTPDHPFPIIPGMVATVEILTGKKSVLDYLIKPARMLKEEALRER